MQKVLEYPRSPARSWPITAQEGALVQFSRHLANRFQREPSANGASAAADEKVSCDYRWEVRCVLIPPTGSEFVTAATAASALQPDSKPAWAAPADSPEREAVW